MLVYCVNPINLVGILLCSLPNLWRNQIMWFVKWASASFNSTQKSLTLQCQWWFYFSEMPIEFYERKSIVLCKSSLVLFWTWSSCEYIVSAPNIILHSSCNNVSMSRRFPLAWWQRSVTKFGRMSWPKIVYKNWRKSAVKNAPRYIIVKITITVLT